MPTGAVAGCLFRRQSSMIEDEQRPAILRFELDSQHGRRLAGDLPVVLDELPRFDPPHAKRHEPSVLEMDAAAAGLQVELGLAEPAANLLGLGHRGPELLGLVVVDALEANAASIAR